MKELMIIEINDQGTFHKSPEKIFYVPRNKTIMFQFIGRRYSNYTPILLSNYHNPSEKKYQIDSGDEKPTTLEQLRNGYNTFEGDCEDNLNWTCKVTFERSGLYFFQTVFISKECYLTKENCDMIVSSSFEYVIVNPEFKNEFKLIDSFAQSYNQLENYGSNKYNEAKNFARQKTQQESIHAFAAELLNDTGKLFASKDSLVLSEVEKNTVPMKQFTKFDGLNLMTLFPTMMGPVKEWEDELIYLIERGYRGFHFSPIQLLGVSGSLYCIKDPLTLNPDIFGVA